MDTDIGNSFVITYDSKLHTSIKREKHPLDDNLLKIDIPDNIKSGCYVIYNSMTYKPQVRGRNRLQLIYFLIVNSYIDQNLEYDDVEIQKLLNIDPELARKASSVFSPTQTGYKPKFAITKPEDFISIIAKKVLTEENVNNIIILYKSIIVEKCNFSNDTPKDIAGAVVYYYMICNGYNIDMVTYCDNVNVKYNNVVKIYSNIIAGLS